MSFQAPPPRFDAPGRGRIYDSVLETIGNTPLVRVPRFSASEGVRADLVLKLEFFNPLASVKDRIALGMVMDMEADGRIHPGRSILIEPTSGNTGIGLAFLAASRGYRLILTMPESMSIERRRMLAFLGAEVELTPKEKGMGGAIAKAKELHGIEGVVTGAADGSGGGSLRHEWRRVGAPGPGAKAGPDPGRFGGPGQVATQACAMCRFISPGQAPAALVANSPSGWRRPMSGG